MVIDELITLLGFEVEDDEVKEYKKALGDTANVIAKVAKVATAAAGALLAMTKTSASRLDEQQKFADIINEQVESLQELGFVAERNGGSIDGMNSSLANLNQLISEANRGEGAGVEVFGLLGLGIRNSSGQLKRGSELMLDLADKFQVLSSQQQIEFGRKLGLDDNLILTLRSGRQEIERLRQRARDLGFVIGEESTRQAEAFEDSWLDITKVIQGVKDLIAVDLIPQIREIIELTIDWFITNKELIRSGILLFIRELVNGLRVLFQIVRSAVQAIDLLVESTIGWGGALTVLKFAFAGLIALRIGQFLITIIGLMGKAKLAALLLNVTALLIPLALGALVIGIALLIEEIVVFFQGGETAGAQFVGWITSNFPGVVEVFDKVAAELTNFWGFLKADFEAFVATWQSRLEAIAGFAGKVKDFFTSSGDVKASFEKAITNTNNLNQGSSPGSAASQIRDSSTTNNGGATDNSVTIKADVTVAAGQNPRQAGMDFVDGMQKAANNGRKNVIGARDY